MINSWSAWKRFPDGSRGDHVEAPIGPGVYEVRSSDNGQLIAFGHAGNVANAISGLKVENRRRGWTSMFRREPAVPPTERLEYRTFAAATRSDAKTAAQRLMGLRQNYWRHRNAPNWAKGGHV